jgi:galactokinase/mevalonate kinase-like predicted kinase
VVRITFHKEATCSAFLAGHQEIRKKKLEEKDIAIVIKDSNVQEKFVRISGLPYQMNSGIVKTRFREFGNVLDLRWESYHVLDDEFLYPVHLAYL